MSKKLDFLKKIKITYNAPVTITFSLICVAVMIANNALKGSLIPNYFTVSGSASSPSPFDLHSGIEYLRMFFHIFGHADWNHLLSNLAFILLLGPVIEDRYGSGIIALMMGVTALVTGVLNACFAPLPMTGSSDIAFMMILLTSFTSISKNEIPLSFILVLILYLGRELSGHESIQNISTLAHIAGGLCGSLFAFLATPKVSKKNRESKPKAKVSKQKTWEETAREINEQSPRFKNKKPTEAEEDSTLVGSIEL